MILLWSIVLFSILFLVICLTLSEREAARWRGEAKRLDDSRNQWHSKSGEHFEALGHAREEIRKLKHEAETLRATLAGADARAAEFFAKAERLKKDLETLHALVSKKDGEIILLEQQIHDFQLKAYSDKQSIDNGAMEIERAKADIRGWIRTMNAKDKEIGVIKDELAKANAKRDEFFEVAFSRGKELAEAEACNERQRETIAEIKADKEKWFGQYNVILTVKENVSGELDGIKRSIRSILGDHGPQ